MCQSNIAIKQSMAQAAIARNNHINNMVKWLFKVAALLLYYLSTLKIIRLIALT